MSVSFAYERRGGGGESGQTTSLQHLECRLATLNTGEEGLCYNPLFRI